MSCPRARFDSAGPAESYTAISPRLKIPACRDDYRAGNFWSERPFSLPKQIDRNREVCRACPKPGASGAISIPHASEFLRLVGSPGTHSLHLVFTRLRPLSSEVASVASSNGLSGAWFDPSLEGAGLNIVASPAGLVIYFYGYDANGEQLWLISELYSGPLEFNESLSLRLYEAEGGTFQQPPSPEQGLVEWGRLHIRFDDCANAWALIDGNDGTKVTSQRKLAAIDRTDCQTILSPGPSGLGGAWYDPALDGEGHNFVPTSAGTIVYFYGFTAGGEHRWLLSELIDPSDFAVGKEISVVIYHGRGGTFDQPAPSQEALAVWGTLELSLAACDRASARLTGLDGVKTSQLVKLAGIRDASCP